MKTKSFCDQIREAVSDVVYHGLSRRHICQETGIDEGAMSRFMKGDSFPREANLDALAKLLGLHVERRLDETSRVNVPVRKKPAGSQERVAGRPKAGKKRRWTYAQDLKDRFPKLFSAKRVVFQENVDKEVVKICVAILDKMRVMVSRLKYGKTVYKFNPVAIKKGMAECRDPVAKPTIGIEAGQFCADALRKIDCGLEQIKKMDNWVFDPAIIKRFMEEIYDLAANPSAPRE